MIPCSVYSQVEDAVRCLYLSGEVRYTIFRATKTRDIPTSFRALGALPTSGCRMHKILRLVRNSRSQGGNGHLLARRQRLARGVELAGETQSARVLRIGLDVKAQVDMGNWKRARCSRQRFRVTDGWIRCDGPKSLVTPTPFSAHLVGRQPD